METNRLPWYELGEDVKTALTMEEAMKQGNLDFEVQKVQVSIPSAENTSEDGTIEDVTVPISGGMMEVDGAFATRRIDTGHPLGIVGSRYSVIQNTEAFGLFDPLLTDGSLRLDVAGCLGEHGEKIWVLAEVGDPVLLVEGDELKRYVLLLNSHDGSTALRILNTAISTVRATTQIEVAGAERALSIRHTQSASDRLDKARDIVSRSLEYYENYIESARALIAKQLTAVDVKQFVESFFTAKVIDGKPVFSTRALNQMKIIEQIFADEPVTATKGTAWALYNALAEFVDHHRSPTGTKAQKYRRLSVISVGTGADMKKKAFRSLLKK